MATYELNVNGQRKQVNVDPSTPLLWVLRDHLGLMIEIGVHHHDDLAVRLFDSTAYRGGEAAHACAADDSDVAAAPRRDLRRTVGTVVVDDDDL